MGNLYFIGLMLAIGGMIMLNMENVFYKPTIVEIYEKCDSWCIRENGTSPCNCKTITEKDNTAPIWYGIGFIVLMMIGLIIAIIGFMENMKKRNGGNQK